MVKNPRQKFAAVLFFGMAAPLLLMLAMMAMTPAQQRPFAGWNGRGGAKPLAAFMGRGSGAGGAANSAGATRAKDAPLRAASDGHDLWVERPFMFLDSDGKSARGFELLRRTGDSGVWSWVGKNSENFWTGYPQAIALIPQPSGANAGVGPAAEAAADSGAAYVINEGGNVSIFSMDGTSTVDQLPASHVVKAAAASSNGIFALTLGAPGGGPAAGDGASDVVGGRLWPIKDYSTPNAASRPRAQPPTPPAPTTGMNAVPANAPATAGASSAPAATAETAATRAATPPGAPATAAADVFNLYWLHDGYWMVLPPLGAPSANAGQTPTTASLIAMTATGSRVIVMWADALEPQTLIVRTLDVDGGSTGPETQPATATATRPIWAWSAPIVSHLSNTSIPAKSRLFALLLENVPYVLWTEPSGGPLILRGGPLGPDLKLNEAKLLPAMPLGAPSEGAAPETDVAVGTVENSLVAVVLGKDNNLSTSVFNARGTMLAGAVAVEPRTARRDLQVGQSIAMLLLVLVFSLSLWQWRQKPIALALPAELVAAPLSLRAAAFAIDAAIPLVIVLAAFGELGSFWAVVSGWMGKLMRPEELLRIPELLIFLGAYVLHVTVGELFFRRSIGKAAVGLQVLMMDGKSPTVGAIALRNLVRVPEMALGFVIFYVLISEQHQRLGDLLARTIVVAARPPEVPEDVDKP